MLNLKFRPAINYRLASAINPPASPSTNLRLRWCFDLRLCPGSFSNLRRRSTLGGASDQLPTSSEIASFSLSFGSASDSRRMLLFQSSFRTNFQSFVGHLVFPLTFRPTSSLRRILHRLVLPLNPTSSFRWLRILRLSSWTDLRLAPDIASSSSAFQPTSDSSSDIASLTSPSDQLPTCVGALSSSSAFPTNLPTCAGRSVLGLSL